MCVLCLVDVFGFLAQHCVYAYIVHLFVLFCDFKYSDNTLVIVDLISFWYLWLIYSSAQTISTNWSLFVDSSSTMAVTLSLSSCIFDVANICSIDWIPSAMCDIRDLWLIYDLPLMCECFAYVNYVEMRSPCNVWINCACKLKNSRCYCEMSSLCDVWFFAMYSAMCPSKKKFCWTPCQYGTCDMFMSQLDPWRLWHICCIPLSIYLPWGKIYICDRQNDM